MLKVLIADDHPLFRDALKRILADAESEFSIIEAGGLDQARAKADDDLDLVLLDLDMPQADGFSALVTLRSEIPSVPIVVVSATADIDTVGKARTYGAAGFIPKTTEPERMRGAIETVLDGGHFWPEMPEPPKVDRSEVEDKLASLTPSELKVLHLIAEGKANKQIAYELDVKESTIKSHITALLRKLKVHSRTQAVLMVNQMGFRK